jgi:hypothetical protein
MAFKNQRRQRFIDEAHYKDFREELQEYLNAAHESLQNPDQSLKAKRSTLWAVATHLLEILILDYTAGHPINELSEQLPAVIEAFNTFIPFDNPRPNEAHTLEITQQEAYVYVLWLLSLCKLLGHDELIGKVMSWLNGNAEFNRGRDTIFERIVEKLTGDTQDPGRYALHPDAYRPLGRAILAEDPAERPALVKEFVENWYKNMKPCYWYGTHTDKEGSSYFGYWCFEAALVTYLWDIDDTSYRDHLVYPKDLIDFARSLPAEKPSYPSQSNRCEANQPCPRSGLWYTPAKENSERAFKAGEIMPDYPDSAYGATIWYWSRSNATE